MTIINIIPSDYDGDPRKALGYCWQDYANRIPGMDVIVTRDKNTGIDYEGAALKAMREAGLTEAYVTCMWAGGFQGDINVTPTQNKVSAYRASMPLSASESAHAEYTAICLDESDLDARNGDLPGYCHHCHGFCYGDCEANL